MPMTMLKLRPGVNVEITASQNEMGISACQMIRFRASLAEKLGGWIKYVTFALGGIPKAMHAWLDLNDVKYLTVGCDTILANVSETDGDSSTRTLGDLTPQQLTSDFAPDFDTTNGDATVTINDPNIANVTDLDAIEFKTPIAVGGLILSGVHPIATVTGTTTYTIEAASNATSTVVSGGATPVFTVTESSTEVSVLLTAHALSEGGTINFPIPTTVSEAGNNAFMKSLVHFNGADASTTAPDDAAGATATHTWTAAGNAQIDTASFAFGGASTLLDGTGDYWTTPDHADFTLGSGVWAVGIRFNCNVAGGSVERIAGQCDATATAASTSILIQRTAGNVILARACVGGVAFDVTGTTQFTNALNTGWHSIVFRRNASNNLQLFIDGVQEGGDIAITGTVNDSAEVWAIGTNGAVTTDSWTGWLDEFYLYVGDSTGAPFSGTAAEAEWGGQAIEIEGTYTAVEITDANNFTIIIGDLPDASSVIQMNGGLAELLYYIALGPTTAGTGYGTGTYGTGGYGIGVGAASHQTGTPITTTDYSLDNWGDTLLASPADGGIYRWRPNTGFQNAQLVSGGPAYNAGFFISMQTQMVIAYGSTEQLNIGIDQNRLLVRWSAQADYTNWTPAVTNQAGSRVLPTGSRIIGGMSVPQQELLWTDLDLWAMTYLGGLRAGVWGFRKIGSNCGLIGKHAAARQGANVYWMGESNFYSLGGGAPQIIPCTVWDAVFQDLNTTHKSKCWAWSNTPFNEIWFYYPRASTSATEPDAYVKYHTVEQVWDPTATPVLQRNAGIDQSILGKPIAATSAGVVYEHETSPNADGQAMNSWFQTGDYQLSEGQDVIVIDWALPDMRFAEYPATSGATVKITLYSKMYPNETPVTKGPFVFTADTKFINMRVRGRLVALRVESDDLDSFWRTGGIRFRVQQDGRN